jgi:hypothetical protein
MFTESSVYLPRLPYYILTKSGQLLLLPSIPVPRSFSRQASHQPFNVQRQRLNLSRDREVSHCIACLNLYSQSISFAFMVASRGADAADRIRRETVEPGLALITFLCSMKRSALVGIVVVQPRCARTAAPLESVQLTSPILVQGPAARYNALPLTTSARRTHTRQARDAERRGTARSERRPHDRTH